MLLLLLSQVMDIKNVQRLSLAAYKSPTGKYVPKERCWNADCKADVALPCATQVHFVVIVQSLVQSLVKSCRAVHVLTQ
jgi:glutamate dehydrogenase/leucine dehydrogenase